MEKVRINYVRTLSFLSKGVAAYIVLLYRSKKCGPSKYDAAQYYVEENTHLEVRLQPNPAYCPFHEAALQLHSPGSHGSPDYENVPMCDTYSIMQQHDV